MTDHQIKENLAGCVTQVTLASHQSASAIAIYTLLKTESDFHCDSSSLNELGS